MLIDGVVQNRDLTKEAANALAQFLSKLTPIQLAHTVIEGLTCTEAELVKEDAAPILPRMCSSYEEFLKRLKEFHRCRQYVTQNLR